MQTAQRLTALLRASDTLHTKKAAYRKGWAAFLMRG